MFFSPARCHEVDFDYDGADIAGSNPIPGFTASALACQAACQALSTCTHWTYGYSGADAGKCWLKTSQGTRGAKTGYTSGPKYC